MGLVLNHFGIHFIIFEEFFSKNYVLKTNGIDFIKFPLTNQFSIHISVSINFKGRCGIDFRTLWD